MRPSILFTICVYICDDVLSVCTDIKRFEFLTKNFTTSGPPLATIVRDLLGCVHFCRHSRCCRAFIYHPGNETCSTHFYYSNLTSGHIGSDSVYSLIKDWKEFGVSNNVMESNTQSSDINTKGYNCVVRIGDDVMSYYKGTLNVTKNGAMCQRWGSQTPNKHKTGRKSEDFVNSGECIDAVANYCRRPLGYKCREPWCFTTVGIWGTCDVKDCSG